MEMVVMSADQVRTLMIEAASIALKHYQPPLQSTVDHEPFGDFNWLCNTLKNIPQATLRIKSAAGEIPGVAKFGKRVLYEKAVVLSWLRSQTRQPVDTAQLEQQAEEQLSRQLSKKGGVHA